ncbi:MAG: malonyl-CoA decarboxylase family protein, partial [Burkholderiaceae bacterium]|nr:malonyl-CoA decarboxylase family protein [Burkholderiaceae bacterium]
QRERLVAGANGAALRAMFERLDASDWPARDGASADEPLLVPLAAYYLTRAKRGVEPIDAVARFHLGNGAVLERLNWLGDTSLHGLARSYGLMCNYVYRLGEGERNHELFVNEHRVLASDTVRRAADIAAAWFGPATA